MLDLDSAMWSELTHAYGPAVDTPDLLRRIYFNPSGDDWSDLYGTVAHQGSISNAAYAAAPHVMAAAEAAPKRNLLDYVGFMAFLELGYDKEPVPSALESDYERAVERARELAFELVEQRWDYTEAVYVLQAIAALSGKTTVGRVVEGLVDREFQLDCPLCAHHLYVETEADGFSSFAEDPIRSPAPMRRNVIPRKLAPWEDESMASCAADRAWLRKFAANMGQSQIETDLEFLNGDCECPSCGGSFCLFETLVRAPD